MATRNDTLTFSTPLLFLRALILLGVSMFAYRHRMRILMDIHPFWFTTLAVLVVQAYYPVAARMFGP